MWSVDFAKGKSMAKCGLFSKWCWPGGYPTEKQKALKSHLPPYTKMSSG
jgi:hypothetical protein